MIDGYRWYTKPALYFWKDIIWPAAACHSTGPVAAAARGDHNGSWLDSCSPFAAHAGAPQLAAWMYRRVWMNDMDLRPTRTHTHGKKTGIHNWVCLKRGGYCTPQVISSSSYGCQTSLHGITMTTGDGWNGVAYVRTTMWFRWFQVA